MPLPAGTSPRGAYGLRLEGLEQAADLLGEAAPDWPLLTLAAELGAAGDDWLDEVGPDRASLRLRTGGRIAIDRVAGSALISTPRALTAFEIVHPYLAPIAAVMAHWLGRESFHGGAVCVDGAAWAVLGDRDAGKSTLLAQLNVCGAAVVSDDQLVVADASCFSGPRSIDLRRSAAERLGGEQLGVVGMRERWRIGLGDVPSRLPLAGWFYLEWDDEVGVEPVGAADRVRRLAAQRGLRVPSRDPSVLLALAALPSFVLRRPRRWDALRDCADALLAAARA